MFGCRSICLSVHPSVCQMQHVYSTLYNHLMTDSTVYRVPYACLDLNLGQCILNENKQKSEKITRPSGLCKYELNSWIRTNKKSEQNKSIHTFFLAKTKTNAERCIVRKMKWKLNIISAYLNRDRRPQIFCWFVI